MVSRHIYFSFLPRPRRRSGVVVRSLWHANHHLTILVSTRGSFHSTCENVKKHQLIRLETKTGTQKVEIHYDDTVILSQYSYRLDVIIIVISLFSFNSISDRLHRHVGEFSQPRRRLQCRCMFNLSEFSDRLAY